MKYRTAKKVLAHPPRYRRSTVIRAERSCNRRMFRKMSAFIELQRVLIDHQWGTYEAISGAILGELTDLCRSANLAVDANDLHTAAVCCRRALDQAATLADHLRPTHGSRANRVLEDTRSWILDLGDRVG